MNIYRKYKTSLTVLELQDRLLKIDRLVTKDDVSVYGQVKTASYGDKVCLRKTGEMEYELSENFGYKGPLETIVSCSLNQSESGGSIIDFRVTNGNKASKVTLGIVLIFPLVVLIIQMYTHITGVLVLKNLSNLLILLASSCLVLLVYRFLMAQAFIGQVVKSIGVLEKYA